MDLLDRVRQYDPAARPGRRRTRVSWPRCRAGPTRSRSRTFCARSTRPASCRLAGLAHFNHQLRAAADARRAVLRASSPRRSGVPLLVGPRRRRGARARASGARSRTRRARRATRSSSARARTSAPTSWRSATRATIRPRRFCCGCCAAPGRAGWRRCIRGAARSSVRCSTAGAPSFAAYLDARGASPFVDDESNDDVRIPRNRVRAELLPLLEARFNPSIVDVLADEAELARDEWQWMETAATGRAARLVRRDDGERPLHRRCGARARCRSRSARLVAAAGDDEAAGGRPIALRPRRGGAAACSRARRPAVRRSRASAWNASARTSS